MNTSEKRQFGLRTFCFFITLILSSLCIANDLNEVEKKLIQDIQKTTLALSKLELDITEKQNHLARKLDKKQQSVAALRKKTAAARRLADEEILGIDTLKKRVKQWQDQGSYQHHLLINFADKLGIQGEGKKQVNQNFQQGLDLLQRSVNDIQRQISPQWQDKSVVLQDGNIENVPTLNLGPVSWYIHGEEGGLLTQDNDPLPVSSYQFSKTQYQQIKDIYSTGSGEIIFDPSLDRALEVLNKQESAYEHLAKGGIWSIPILIFAFISTAIALYKLSQLLRLPKFIPMLPESLDSLLASGKPHLRKDIESLCKKTQGAQRKILKISINAPSIEKRDDLLVSFLMENKHELEKLMSVITMTAAVAPLLGLLGTVSGMIETFKMMTIFGAGDPSAVSGGISEALVTTELGLVVAIPALIINAVLSQKIKHYHHQLETMAIKVSKIEFRPQEN